MKLNSLYCCHGWKCRRIPLALSFIILIFFYSGYLKLDPYPTVNATRYNIQTVNRSVDPDWSTVAYYYGATSIALFAVQDGKRKDFANQSSGRYTTDCDDSTIMFYLNIYNVSDDYNGKTIQCRITYSTGNSSEVNSVIYVQCKSFYIAY